MSPKHRTRTPTRRTLLKRIAQSGVVAGLMSGVTTTDSAESTGFTRIPRVEIESFDGTTLVGSVYEPAGSRERSSVGESPAVLLTHGWGGDRMDERPVRLAERYARNGYVVLVYDSRGFGESDGTVGLDGPNEVRDASVLISWLGRRSTVQTDDPIDDRPNPRVGMDGVSYAGGIQLNVASVDSRLDVMVPRWAWHDLTHSLAPDGVIKTGWITLLYIAGIVGARGISSGDMHPSVEDIEHGIAPQFHEIYLDAVVENELSENARTYLNDRSPNEKLDRIGTPALFISGWSDTLFTPNEAVRNYRQLRDQGVETRLLLFDGGHALGALDADETVRVIDDAALAWIDAHLQDNTPAPLSPITYYQKRTDSLAQIDRFPDLSANEELMLSLGSAALGPRSLLVNSVIPTSTSQLVPVNVDLASGITAVSFDFLVDEPFELLGTPVLDIALAPLGPETRLFAKLSRIHNGAERQLYSQTTPFKIEESEESEGSNERTQRESGAKWRKEWDGEWKRTLRLEAEPKPKRKRVELVATQRQFDANDALRLTLATTDAGFFSSRRSLGAYIYHSEETPTTLSIPIRRG